MEKQPVVYFVQGIKTKHIKIGKASTIKARLSGLQTGSAERLVLLGVQPGGRELERYLHMRFATHRLHGEWFKPHRAIRVYIAEHALPHDDLARYERLRTISDMHPKSLQAKRFLRWREHNPKQTFVQWGTCGHMLDTSLSDLEDYVRAGLLSGRNLPNGDYEVRVASIERYIIDNYHSHLRARAFDPDAFARSQQPQPPKEGRLLYLPSAQDEAV